MHLRRGSLFVSFAVVALAVIGCPGQSLFPTCEDPAHPCPPVDPNYPEDSFADGAQTPGGRACRSLRAVGCPEGFKDPRTAKTCYQRLEGEAQLVRVPLECVADARTAAAVRNCGTKDTLRFRCNNTDGGA